MTQSNFSLTDRGVDLTSTLTLSMAGNKQSNVCMCMCICMDVVVCMSRHILGKILLILSCTACICNDMIQYHGDVCMYVCMGE